MEDLSGGKIGQGKNVALCNHNGVLLKDPIAEKVSEDTFWLSSGKSDIGFRAACVVRERGHYVEISESDVSSFAIQSLKAAGVVAVLHGDWGCDLRHFWFKDAVLEGFPLEVVRAPDGQNRAGFSYSLRRPKSQTKNAPPTRPVTIPMGMSSGAMIVRAAISAHKRKMAPIRAEAGRTRV